MAHLEKMMSNGSHKNVIGKDEQSRTFDIVLGVIPAVLVGAFSFNILVGSIAYFQIHSESLLVIAILAFFRMLSCIFLMISIFCKDSLNKLFKKLCRVILSLGIVVALVLFGVFILLSRNALPDTLILLMTIFILYVSLILSALKQIKLLRS